MLSGILVLFLLAALVPVLAGRLGRATAWILAGIPLLLGLRFLRYAPVTPGSIIVERIDWVPSLGADLTFLLDGLSNAFTLLILLIGSLVILYSGAYLSDHRRLGPFLAYLLLFLGSMIGLVLSDNWITLFVFWELTGVASYLLIGFHHESEASRSAALKSLLVTGSGGILLLVGILLAIQAGQDLGLSLEQASRISSLGLVDLRQDSRYPLILVFITLGAFVKSAQVPFHFWLPAAMAAPTPVSAFLHSATMVKAGVYLLARLHPHLGGTPLWQILLISIGGATMLLAAAMALGQRDLKRILAYTTISVLGTLVLLLGVGTDKAVEALVVFLFAHALYKGALFLVAGNIDHGTGTRDADRLGGLIRLMPVTAAAGLLAALSKAGAPPLFGFLGKELLFEAKLDRESIGQWLILLAITSNVLLVASALRVGIRPFLGRVHPTPRPPHEAPLPMLAAPIVLAALGLLVGLAPGPFARHIGSATATAILGWPVDMKLKLWHGLSLEAMILMLLSGLTLAAGFAVYVGIRRGVHRRWPRPGAILRWGPDRLYERGYAGLLRLAGGLTAQIQSGSFRRYLLIVLVSAIILVGSSLFLADLEIRTLDLWDVKFHEALLAVLVLAGVVLTVRSRSRLTGIAALGVTGLAIALIFAVFSAPDLAITQIMVEIQTVILFVLVFHHLPPFSRRSTLSVRLRDLAVAGGVGVLMAALVLIVPAVRLQSTLADFFRSQSVAAAHGRNVVNVILVDFRALDTLGEITVLAMAGIGVFALTRSIANRSRSD